MTDKFDKFKEALIALCEEHDVYIESDWIACGWPVSLRAVLMPTTIL